MRGFLIFLCFAFCVPCFAEDKHGVFRIGEGGEVEVSEGVIVREVAPSTGSGQAPSEGAELPLVAVGTAEGVHYFFDPNGMTMQGFWTGIFGRQGADGSFVPSVDTMKSFHLDQAPPWSFGEKPRRKLRHDWKGYEIRDGEVFFRYGLVEEEGPMSWEVEERLEVVSEQVQQIHFTIEASAEAEEYLSYWVRQTEFRRLSTDGQQNQRNRLKNLHPNQEQFTISFMRRKETPTVPHGYSIENIEIPVPEAPYLFEPTDIDFAPDGSVYTSHRLGQVWRLKEGKWTVFAEGLQEANGIRVAADGKSVYVMQKPELTLLRDTDDDGVADVYETVEDRFRFTGHYHEFAYGPRINAKGEMFFSTGLASSGFHTWDGETQNQMTSALGYRGWVMRRNPDGTLTPFASGLRSPAGIAMNAENELFVTDNQGDWVASSYLGHVEEGDFLGHPAALWDREEYGITPRELDYRTVAEVPEEVPVLDKETFTAIRKRPAVWLAHGDLTNSPGHPSFAPEEGFGPFGGQAFIADIAHRNVVRVALEKVGGQYQGAVFPFIRPLQSSSYSTAFDPEGRLWIGSVGRGWTAGDPAMEVVRYDKGATPFEIQRIVLTEAGFAVHFTEALKEGEVGGENVSVSEFRYGYWKAYGSEAMGRVELPVKGGTLSEDRKVLRVEVERRRNYLYEIQLKGVVSASGRVLENDYGVYTLNELLP